MGDILNANRGSDLAVKARTKVQGKIFIKTCLG